MSMLHLTRGASYGALLCTYVYEICGSSKGPGRQVVIGAYGMFWIAFSTFSADSGILMQKCTNPWVQAAKTTIATAVRSVSQLNTQSIKNVIIDVTLSPCKFNVCKQNNNNKKCEWENEYNNRAI